jgi:CubicO group peptidase (beta-lactamase class C family)
MKNSGFTSDGEWCPQYIDRVQRVIAACNLHGAAVILSLFYQRQFKRLRDMEAVERAVTTTAHWVRQSGWRHLLLEIANESPHPGFGNTALRTPAGMVPLIRLAQQHAPGIPVSASGLGNGRLDPEVAAAADYLTIHLNDVPVEAYPARVEALRGYGKPIICNEDDKGGAAGALALRAAVAAGCGWGLMDKAGNQTRPFVWEGAADDPEVYREMHRLTSPAPVGPTMPAGAAPRRQAQPYFPPPEAQGGWRVARTSDEVASQGVDPEGLEALAEWTLSIQNRPPHPPSPIGFLAIAGGWIVSERYSPEGRADLPTWIASIGKSVSSCALGLWLDDGRRGKGPRLELDSRVYDARWLPDGFPLSDPRKTEIRFWHLLTHTSGIRPEPDTRGGPGFDFAAYTLGHSAAYPESAALAFDPGRGYGYSSVGINHLSLIAPRLADRPLHHEVTARIFAPIGAVSAHWRLQADDAPGDTAAGGPFITARDLARYAYLHLRDGVWGERPVLPQWYLRAARAVGPQCAAQPADYGLGFWTNHQGALSPHLPLDAYAFGGSGLNLVVVVPSRDLIVLRTSRVWRMDIRVCLDGFAHRIANLLR